MSITPKTNTADPMKPQISPLKTGIGKYPNMAVIAAAIIHNHTPFLLDNNSDECFIDFPDAIAITKPRTKIIAPRISMSIFHNVNVKKLSKNIAIPMTHTQIPFFLVSSSILTKNKREI